MTLPGVYPDWPKSAADLVPHPPCDGPKLKAFDFQGPQKIDFLECLGGGAHSVVFKVSILGDIYALKVFRFLGAHNWFGLHVDGDYEENREQRPLCWYGEPFNAECRAFARLQETGREALALKCFGYVLLTEENERDIKDRFPEYNAATQTEIHFNGHGDEFAEPEDLRGLFPTSDGRSPPLRGILKTWGREDRRLTRGTAREMLHNIIKLQQLGIFSLDVALRQIINGKIADFSTSFTTPHFLSNPELNPLLNPHEKHLMEHSLFQFAIADYFDFDTMVREWNEECKNPRDEVAVWAFPHRAIKHKYNSRSTAPRVWSYVDLRSCARIHKKPIENGKATRRNLPSNPPRWPSSDESATWRWFGTTYLLGWEIKGALVFPEPRKF